MSNLYLTLSNGIRISFFQMLEMDRVMGEHGPDRCSWHPNSCGCCVTVHTPGGSYVIDADGGHDFYPEDGHDHAA